MDVLDAGPEARRPHRLRRVLVAAGVPLLVAMLVLAGEAVYVLNQDFLGADDAPDLGGSLEGPMGPPIRLALLGDSTAAGVGVTDSRDSVGGVLGLLLAQRSTVTFDAFGVSGARAADLEEQVDAVLRGPTPDVAVVLIGPNDATHLSRLGGVRSDVHDAVQRLRDAGARVVVGSCADMGSATAFPVPLRQLAAARGRAVGRATREAAREAGAVVVDIGAETGPQFRADPDRYLSEDRFHPSAEGYRLWAKALEDEVLAAALA